MTATVASSDSILPRRAWLAWGCLVFFIPWQLHYDYVLNVFYQAGAPFTDGGVFSHLVWHKDWHFLPPASYTAYTFFATHFTPFLLLLGQLSWFLPVHRVEYFAGIMATIYASLGLALFYAFRCALAIRTHWQMAGLALLAIAFSFNDMVMSGAWIVHFEYAIPLGIFLFLLHFVRRSWPWAIFFFVFTLSLREDAGFHITAMLALLALARYWEQRSIAAVKYELYFMAAAFVYSVLALWLISVMGEGYRGSNFALVYSGDHAYAHLSWFLLWGRAQIIFKTHIEIWLGFYVTMIWAVLARNPYMAVGFAANIPWFLLSWTAASVAAGPLRSYYGFPFVLSLGWPILAGLWRYGIPLPRAAVRETMLFQTAMIAIGLVMWNNDAGELAFGPYYGYGSFRLQKSAENRDVIHLFIAEFNNGAADLGAVMLDSGLLSLVDDRYHGQQAAGLKAQRPVDTLIYMGHPDHPDQDVMDAVSRNHLPYHYCMLGTTICFFTNRTLHELGTFSALMSEKPLPPDVAAQLK